MMSLDYRGFDASHLNSLNSSSNVGKKIHVLLVEHETIDHDNIINMLRCFNYQVSSVNHASSGLSVLSKEKAQFDVVIANMTSPDSFGYQLLQLALNMNLLVILTSNEDDVVGTMRALEQGVFLCVKKPVTMQFLGYLWQHVSREKKATSAQKELASIHHVNHNPQDPDPDQNQPDYKRKVWTEWTVDLHTKFMKAARALGPGRCYPKDILELMNVPGLTRMQVASHLQKCRNAKWLPPHQRKTTSTTKQAEADDQPREDNYYNIPVPKKKAPRSRPESFGSMPRFDDVILPSHVQQYYQNDDREQGVINNGFSINNPILLPTLELQLGGMGYINNPHDHLVNEEDINVMKMGSSDESAMYQTLTPIIPLDDVITHGDSYQFQLGFDYNGTWQWQDDMTVDQVGNGGKLQYWANYGGFQFQNDDGWRML